LLKSWPKQSILHYLPLLSSQINSEFVQLFVIEEIGRSRLSIDILRALIPYFVSLLKSPTKTVSPLSEYLIELSSENPIVVYI